MDHSLRPVCGRCNREYRCVKNEVIVTLGPRTYVWGDKYECPECGAQVITGYGNKVYGEPPSHLAAEHLHHLET